MPGELGVIVHNCNHSTQEVEIRGSWVTCQPGL
jgi:hypothetical protein